MNKKTLITIGIPAYNEEQNIGALLQNLLNQKNKFSEIKKIIVVDDGNDSTAAIISNLNTSNILYIKNESRKSKTAALNKIKANVPEDTEVILLLDADIKIDNFNLVDNVVSSFLKYRWELMSAITRPVTPLNVIQKSLCASRLIINEVIRDYQNALCADGKIMALSKVFLESIHWPEYIAADDMYAYFWCLKLNKTFRYETNFFVSYMLPKTLADHSKQSLRFQHSIDDMKKIFGESMVHRGFRLKKRHLIKVVLKQPRVQKMYFACFFALYLWILIRYKVSSKEGKAAWDMVSSTNRY